MKNFTILFLISLASMLSFSQAETDLNTSVVKYKLDEVIKQVWDENSGQMVNDIKSEYTYNSNGKFMQFIVSIWQGNSWANESKTEFIYNASNFLTETIDYSWGGGWNKVSKSQYTYMNGNLIQDILYHWDGSQWVIGNFKFEYNYDPNGNLIQKIINWGGPFAKQEYSYDSNGKLVQELRYGWSGQWDIHSKIDYNYNNNGILMDYVEGYWDSNNNQWDTTFKTEFSYDNNGNALDYINYNWDSMSGVWTPGSKVEFGYNDSYSLSDLILPYFYNHTEYQIGYIHQMLHDGLGTIFNLDEIFFNHMLTNRIGYYWDGANWVMENDIGFTYSQIQILSTYETDIGEVIIYPNPASEKLNIQLSNGVQLVNINLYNNLGKLIISSDKSTVNVSSLANGIYYLHVETNKGKATKKVIIK